MQICAAFRGTYLDTKDKADAINKLKVDEQAGLWYVISSLKHFFIHFIRTTKIVIIAFQQLTVSYYLHNFTINRCSDNLKSEDIKVQFQNYPLKFFL